MRKTRIKPYDKYGDLTVLRDTGKRDSSGAIIWLCLCDCGNYTEKPSQYLLGNTLTHSCGCKRGEAHVEHGDNRRHGKTARLYSIWRGMLWRCNHKNRSKNSYTKNNIKVCDEWFDYKLFKDWALENGYKDNLSIDRIDYKGDYTPENCRWVSAIEQSNNKSNNHLITYKNKTMTLAEWARETGINYSTLRSRINRQKLSPEKAFCTNKGMRDVNTGRFVGGYDVVLERQ